VLVHTIALELNQRDEMQGEGKKQKGTKTSLTHSFTKQSQHNKHDGQWTDVVPARCYFWFFGGFFPNQITFYIQGD